MSEALLKHKTVSAEENPEVSRWEREYVDLQVIPSSTRQLPSKALSLFSELIDYGKVKEVIEPGCGTGRNAIYLARKGCRVTAVDFSPNALHRLADAARVANVESRIRPCLADLYCDFPFTTAAFDLCMDSYVFCHFVEDRIRHHYWSEVRRVTKPGGLVYSCIFAEDDEYYSAIAEEASGNTRVVTDPENGITKRLYTENEAKDFLSGYFSIKYFLKFQFSDFALGRYFERSVYVLLMETHAR